MARTVRESTAARYPAAVLPLLAIGLALGSIPGEGDAEPVGFLLTANLGALPRAVVELERPLSPWASASLALGSPSLTALGASLSGPQAAVGGRLFVFGRAPWGLFLDGRLLLNLYLPAGAPASSAVVVPGAGVTLGFNAKLWHAVVSPGVSLFYVPDPTAASALFPALRLAVGGWNLTLGAASGERDEEPVGFLLMADVGALPRVALEMEALMVPSGSALVSLGYPVPIGINFNDRIPGPQIAAGWRVYLAGRAPWGLFLDGRVLANLYFPVDPRAPSPAEVYPGGGLTVGLNVKAWRVVVSPGVSLFYTSDPAVAFPVLPALRLAVGGWN